MTPGRKQDNLVRFAEAMGWSLQCRTIKGRQLYHVDLPGRAILRIGDDWDPYKSRDNATELAEKLDIRYSRDPDDFIRDESGTILCYSAWLPGQDHEGGRFFAADLCEAICQAANEGLIIGGLENVKEI